MKRRGFTLPEVLIGASLALVIGLVILNFVVSLFRGYARTTVRDGLQSQATILLGRIKTDLANSSLPALSVRPNGMVFTCLITISGLGQPVWEEKSSAYFWDVESQKLWYRRTPPLPPGVSFEYSPSRPHHFSDSEVDILFRSTTQGAIVLCESVSNFQLSLEGKQLRIRFALEEQAHQNRVERFAIEKLVEIKN